MVPITDFLFGTHWSPQVIDSSDPGATLGAVPLFWGTFFIGAVIAMAVAIPFGLMSAIYLTQYARPSVRRWMKPILEMRSEEHTSELQSLMRISYAVFCLKKKTKNIESKIIDKKRIS